MPIMYCRENIKIKKMYKDNYDLAKKKFLGFNKEKKKELPNVWLLLTSSNTFMSCLVVKSPNELSFLSDSLDCPVPVSTNTLQKEWETFTVPGNPVGVMDMYINNLIEAELENKCLKELRKLRDTVMDTDPKSYEDFADLYYAVYNCCPIEDPRYVKPKKSLGKK